MALGGLDNIKGLEFLNNMDFMSVLGGVGKIIVGILAFVLMGSAVFGLYWYKNKRKLYKEKIHWFEEVNGNMIPVGMDLACELTIPQTNILVFYIKGKDMYLPKLTKRMGKNSYWLAIKNNKEVVNFTMTNINEETGKAGLNYDHTDMRYALQNLLALIKRNYKDKAQPWWREYKDVIAIVIFIFVMTLSVFFILQKVGTLLDKVGILIEHADTLIKTAESIRGSGVSGV